jgi:hypothetical protein
VVAVVDVINQGDFDLNIKNWDLINEQWLSCIGKV